MFEVSAGLAFLGGVVSFFAPCVLPLLPVYIAYITGVSLEDLEKGKKISQKKIFLSSLFYILGFSIVFVLLGSVIGGVGKLLRLNSLLVQQVAGIIIIFFGLEFMGVINVTFMSKKSKILNLDTNKKTRHFRSFLLGIIFAVTWTPCVGAVLGSILALAAIEQTVSKGALLLFFYSLGISLPFLIVSLTLSRASGYLSFIKERINVITKISGIILIVLGGLLVTDTYKYLNAWLLSL